MCIFLYRHEGIKAKFWDKGFWKQAIIKVEEGVSIRSAANNYNIPKSTLRIFRLFLWRFGCGQSRGQKHGQQSGHNGQDTRSSATASPTPSCVSDTISVLFVWLTRTMSEWRVTLVIRGFVVSQSMREYISPTIQTGFVPHVKNNNIVCVLISFLNWNC